MSEPSSSTPSSARKPKAPTPPHGPPKKPPTAEEEAAAARALASRAETEAKIRAKVACDKAAYDVQWLLLELHLLFLLLCLNGLEGRLQF